MPVSSGLLTRARQSAPGFFRNNELLKTLAAFWSFALIHRREGIKIGGNYTFVGKPTVDNNFAPEVATVVITAQNIVSILKDANKAGVGYFIADANITTPMPETKQESIVLAAYAGAKSTNITAVKYDAVLRHAENEEFANYLRNNPEEDLWLFTNTGFVHVPYLDIPLVYSSVGIERTGPETTSAGGLKFSVMGKSFNGSPLLQIGDTSDSKTFPSYNVSIIGTLANAKTIGTKGDVTVIARTVAIEAVKIPLTNGGYATDWRLVDYATGLDLSGSIATFDETDLKLVIPSNAPAGTLKIKVIAHNPAGVTGEKLFEIKLV